MLPKSDRSECCISVAYVPSVNMESGLLFLISIVDSNRLIVHSSLIISRNDAAMRFPGSSKDKKAKNNPDDDESSEAGAPVAASQVQVKRIFCAKCGKVFSEPVKLTVKGKGSADEYSACPHCFSRISSFYTEETSRASEESVDVDEPVPEDVDAGSEETEVTEETEEAEETEEPASVVEGAKPEGCACGHSVGYLKTLPKGSPTPDECFTCPSLIKCKY